MCSGICRRAFPDAVTVETLAQRARVGVYSLASARVHFRAAHRADEPRHHSRLCRVVAKQIEKGIARLSDAIDDAIDDPATDMTALFSDQFAPAGGPGFAGNIWHHDIGSNRLYGRSRRVVHFRKPSSHDKVPRQCRS